MPSPRARPASNDPGWFMHSSHHQSSPASTSYKATSTTLFPATMKTFSLSDLPLPVLRVLGQCLQDIGEWNTLRDLTASNSTIRDAILSIAWEELSIDAEDKRHVSRQKERTILNEVEVRKELLEYVRVLHIAQDSSERLVECNLDFLPSVGKLVPRNSVEQDIGIWTTSSSDAEKSNSQLLETIDLDLRLRDWSVIATKWLEEIAGESRCQHIKLARFVIDLHLRWSLDCEGWGSLLRSLRSLTICHSRPYVQSEPGRPGLQALIEASTFPNLMSLTLERTWDEKVQQSSQLWDSSGMTSSRSTPFLGEAEECALALAPLLPSLQIFRASNTSEEAHIEEGEEGGEGEEQTVTVFEWVIIAISRKDDEVKTKVDVHGIRTVDDKSIPGEE